MTALVDSNVLLDLFTRDPVWFEYIGAHAAVSGFILLTRDAARYRTYFPHVRIVAPVDNP